MVEIACISYLVCGVGFILIGKELEKPTLLMLGSMLLVFGAATAFAIMSGQK